jgi:hypothetical protein
MNHEYHDYSATPRSNVILKRARGTRRVIILVALVLPSLLILFTLLIAVFLALHL